MVDKKLVKIMMDYKISEIECALECVKRINLVIQTSTGADGLVMGFLNKNLEPTLLDDIINFFSAEPFLYDSQFIHSILEGLEKEGKIYQPKHQHYKLTKGAV